MVLTVSAFVAIAGVLMYALCVNTKLAEIGRIMFFAGLLTLLMNSGAILRIAQ